MFLGLAMAELRDLRVHTCALNARDLDALANQAIRNAPCFRDGEWVGEGPEGVRQALEKEFAMNDEAFARIGTVDGRPAVLGFDGGGTPRAVLHFVGGNDGRIRELRIDHAGSPARPARPPVRFSIDEPAP